MNNKDIDYILFNSNIPELMNGNIKVSINSQKKVFCLTTPIFTPFWNIPKPVSEYVSKRKTHSFKPHSTSFQNNGREILLVQEISFDRNLRRHLIEFWNIAKHCHQMLKEIAVM